MDKLSAATEALFLSLTTHWEDNGNILAEAVRDKVIDTLQQITDKNIDIILAEVENRIDQAQ